METLANLTRADINNGALVRILASVGIPDVSEYVRKFHEETEDIIIDQFEHSDPNKTENDEQIIPPADLQRWITAFRPRLQEVNQQPLSEPVSEKQQEQPQQKMPTDIQSWMSSLGPRLNDPNPPTSENSQQQQQEQRQLPTNLNSWALHIAPTSFTTFSDTTATIQSTTDNNSNTDISAGNIGIWLNNWTRSLAEQPPPTSLDTWLKSLISENITEPIGKANTPKGRLNTYLNAAQQVLSQHGYEVSNEIEPPTSVKIDTGMFGNVKQMYFLWKTLDKNNDRKITVEDVQIMLQEMGLGFLSKYVAQTLFEMVDSNHDGTLQFRDFIALMGIIKQLIGAMESTKA